MESSSGLFFLLLNPFTFIFSFSFHTGFPAVQCHLYHQVILFAWLTVHAFRDKRPEMGQSYCIASHIKSKGLNFEFRVLNKSLALFSSTKFTQIVNAFQNLYFLLKMTLRQEASVTNFFMVCSLTWLDASNKVDSWGRSFDMLRMKSADVSWFRKWREILFW